MNTRGLRLDGQKRRGASLVVASVISMATLIAPAGAWSGQRASIDDGAGSWTHVKHTHTSFGRSWS